MRQIFTTVLASLASLTVIGAAHAQTYTGHSAVAGVTTFIPAANDVPAVVDLQTLTIRLTTTTGAVVPMTLNGALNATYTSGVSTTNIAFFPMTPTQTRVKISQSALAGGFGIRRVEFGTVNSRAGFDIVNATVRTPGSGLGFAPLAAVLAGPSAWVAGIQFTNRVALVGAAAQNDLYKTMNVNFTAPMVNGTFEFIVDTDRLY
mgnify:CR=1 FL=1|jgi:hypothetical protein